MQPIDGTNTPDEPDWGSEIPICRTFTENTQYWITTGNVKVVSEPKYMADLNNVDLINQQAFTL